jgi:flagellar biosynthesis protein FlhA
MRRGTDLVVALAIFSILLIILLPLPSVLIDFLIILSFSAAVMILFTSLYIKQPIEFSIYPTVLLIVTLYRLSLNIATTRRILAHGHEFATGEITGKVSFIIEFFGNVVMAGNFVIGLIIFIVLTIINLIVITRGAGRIAEVAARFTLDSLPGKQLSIDADLNAGLITVEEAKERRQRLTREADFYGAMDGASKFIRGEAVASIIILFVNIIGGIIIGTLQKGLAIGTALSTFTKLTVGDGLVAQIPALMVSTSAGIIISRSSGEMEFTQDITKQFTAYPKAILASAIVIGMLGLVVMSWATPIFLMLAGGLLAYAIRAIRKEEEGKKFETVLKEQKSTQEFKMKPEEEEKQIETILQPDVLGLEVGYALVPYVDETQNGEVVRRIKGLRRTLAEEIGIILPPVHIRDNLSLKPNEYSIILKGVEIMRGEIIPGKYLVVGTEKPDIEGTPARDPVFGIETVWIDESQKPEALAKGYTVVDPASVIITHFSEMVRRNAHEILTRQDTQKLLDITKKNYPKLVEDVTNLVSLSTIHRVLQNLLKEGIPIKDLITILEAIGDWGGTVKDPDQLTEYVRQALWRQITKMYEINGEIIAISLDPQTEEKILEGIEEKEGVIKIKIPPQFVQKLINSISENIQKFVRYKAQPIVITSQQTRRFVKRMIENYFPMVPVISYQEIDPKIKIRILGIIKSE